MFAGNFAPVGWMFCNGQILPISQYEVLYQLIGTTYGGDGQQTFQLPNLQSRVPLHLGSGYVLGQPGGTETVTLTTAQIPAHTHVPQANSAGGNAPNPAAAVWAAASADNLYSTSPTTGAMNAAAIGNTGGTLPHDNMLPFLAVSFIISLFGVFPSQN
jgi:microcystin-dependent protein